MRILIVEDEASVANRIEKLTRQTLGNKIEKIDRCPTLASAIRFIENYQFDLLLLDLNLNGQDGFSILKTLVSYQFHTIIISANTHQALEAFEYGVLDFIPKPFTKERLAKAFARHHDFTTQILPSSQYLTVRKKGGVIVIKIEDILYIKASGNYSELYLKNGEIKLHDKSLNNLEILLPNNFKRTHRSYICNWEEVEILHNHGAGKYEVEMKSGVILPVSRNKYQELI